MKMVDSTPPSTIPFLLILKATNTPFASQDSVEMPAIPWPTLPWTKVGTMEEWTSQPSILITTEAQSTAQFGITKEGGGSTIARLPVLRAHTPISTFDGIACITLRRIPGSGQLGW